MTATPLQIERWAAWAPGLATQSDWLHWLAQPQTLAAEPAAPALPEVPAMTRRRIEPLGRAALQVSYWAQDDLAPEQVQVMPLVFASRWGELGRSLSLLQDLARRQPLSPTAFSHSVHNAVGALYSIQRGVRANLAAVAAGAYSAEAGWIEAAGLIAAGAPQVLLTVFDAELPSAYEGSGLDAALAGLHAYSLRLSAAPASGLRLDAGPERGRAHPSLPPSLSTLAFVLGVAEELAQGPWHWSRGHG